MTCQELLDFLMDYVDGQLPAAQLDSFEQHLRACPPCVHYVDSYRETAALGQSICHQDDALPPEVPEALIEAILRARQS
jgi:anti-sigma factor RsiW